MTAQTILSMDLADDIADLIQNELGRNVTSAFRMLLLHTIEMRAGKIIEGREQNDL